MSSDGSPYTFAPMVIADYEPVMALWTGTAGLRLRGADSRPAIERYLARNPNLSFVARHGDRIVGAVLGGHDGRRGYLQHLAVAEDHRGRGVGARLVRHCTDALAAEGIAKTHLFVLNDNAGGLAFWRHLGWQPRPEVTMFSHLAAPDPEA